MTACMSGTLLSAADAQAHLKGKGAGICAVLFANSRPRIAGYLALANAIAAEGHVCIVVHPYASVPSEEELLGFEHVTRAALSKNEIKGLQGVDVFVSPELIIDTAPPGAATVALHHSLPENLNTNYAGSIRNSPTIIRAMDYLVVALKQRSSAWKASNYALVQNVYPPEFLRDRRATLDIVPGGYPKIDYLEKAIGAEASLDTIIYSPTVAFHPDGQIKRGGEEIIAALLDRFGDQFRIVLRPYPIEQDAALGREIATRFSERPNFDLDLTVTGLENQRRCAVVVTDKSSSAVSFSLAAGRPAVFVNLDDPGSTAYNQRIEFFGFRCVGLPAALNAVDLCLGSADYWRGAIGKRRGAYLYNPGSASAYLAKKLPVFARRETDPEWLSVARTPWLGYTDRGESERHLRRLLDASKGRLMPGTKLLFTELRQYLESLHGPLGVEETS